jgi:hypothetical protein
LPQPKLCADNPQQSKWPPYIGRRGGHKVLEDVA